jgi:TRAP-type C4-dicarboxylate transport system permease small subunit
VRFFPVASLHWFDEIIELVYAYLIFYGAAALRISREHFGVGDWIGKRIKQTRMRHLYKLIIQLFVMDFVLIFFYYSFQLTLLARDVTNVFAIPKKVLYSCLPISGFIMVIHSIRNIAVEVISFIKS